jgi:predicted alpha/beta superfamily hydrolase
MKYLLPFLLILAIGTATAQTTLVVRDIPADTPADGNIYIAGSFNGWNPGDNQYRLTREDGGYYRIILNHTGNIQFKFTLGSWNSVETDGSSADIPNRELALVPGDSVFLAIEGWKSGEKLSPTVSPNVTVVDSVFLLSGPGSYRTIRIYLPPGYHQTSERFPVLYMHDGQNLFDRATSFSGEWEVDELFDRLHAEGKKVPIVVGIDNGGERRISEYTPWKNEQYGGGEGDEYARFVLETLKPYIDHHYRTLPGRENSAVAGSSLGGLISFYMILRYPEVFSMAAVFSPSFWYSREVYTFARAVKRKHPARIYMMGGTDEYGQLVPQMEEMQKILRKRGYRKNEVHLKVVEGGKHNEELWRTQMEDAFNWLFRQ